MKRTVVLIAALLALFAMLGIQSQVSGRGQPGDRGNPIGQLEERMTTLEQALSQLESGVATLEESQTSVYVLRNQSSGAETRELFLDGLNQRLTIDPTQTLTFDILVVARSHDGDSAGYRVYGVIENDGGTTAFIGVLTPHNQGQDVESWDLSVEADDAHDALVIKGTGSPGKTVRWLATVRTVEVDW